MQVTAQIHIEELNLEQEQQPEVKIQQVTKGVPIRQVNLQEQVREEMNPLCKIIRPE